MKLDIIDKINIIFLSFLLVSFGLFIFLVIFMFNELPLALLIICFIFIGITSVLIIAFFTAILINIYKD